MFFPVFLSILTVLLSFYFLNKPNTINDPKMYILKKYNDYLLNNYNKIFDMSLNNEELKKDILKYIKDIVYISSFYEFDLFFRNESSFYYEYETPNYMKYYSSHTHINYLNDNITRYNEFINIDNEFIDYHSKIVRTNYITQLELNLNHNKFKKIINNYFLNDILKINYHFLYHFAKNFKLIKNNLHKNDDNSYIFEPLFEHTIKNSNFNNLFYVDNNSIYKLISEDLAVLNKRYICIEIIGTKCPIYNINNSKKKVNIYDSNSYFNVESVFITKCCTI